MARVYTETIRRSWFTRLKNSLFGTIIGLLIFLGSFAVLFWNEGRAVDTQKMLTEGAGVVISVASGRADPANEGKLVHVSGQTETSDMLEDPVFDVSVNAIKLYRKVEMLQWRQKVKSSRTSNFGGSTDTTKSYYYEKDWSETLIDSSTFKDPVDHENPQNMLMKSEKWQASNVTLGAFDLSKSQISSINNAVPLAMDTNNRISRRLGDKARIFDGVLYLGSPSRNRVGDYRISMRVVYPGDTSIVSGQSGNGFKPYKTQVGGAIEMLTTSIKPAEAMFDSAEAANTALTWTLRVVGLLMMYFGLTMMVKILSVFASVVPFFGSIVSGGTSLIAFLVALVLSLITIAIAWVFYRPLITGILLVAAVGIYMFTRKKVNSATAAAADDGEAEAQNWGR